MCNFDLVSYQTTIDDLHQVSLCVQKNTDNSVIFADTFELTCNIFSTILGMFISIVSEGHFLKTVPVLVEVVLDFVRKMGSPDSSESVETVGSFNVAND